jgi:hypothetical protein
MAPQVAHITAAEPGRDVDWEKQQESDFQELAMHYLLQ